MSSEPSPDLPPHVSVLPRETLELLRLRPGDLAVDATLGAGGHAALMLEALGPGGRLLGLDVDPTALELARARLEPRAQAKNVTLELRQANFRELPAVLAGLAPAAAPRGILADLGVSSMQLDDPGRGFSFRHDAPLDLRLDPTLPRSAAEYLAEAGEAELADALFHLGGERQSRKLARWLVEARRRNEPVRTTGDLERLVRRALKVRGHQRIHPATRTFQALRMAVNDELGALEAFLEAAPETLAPGGTLCAIAFHSGEDRLVKQAFKRAKGTGRFQVLTKSVVRPEADESQANPRSRSAKLRALRRRDEA
ncbi:MAG: 16S rRNA (cytosine(1402)-N(4))-methyltransferase RsmH [Planctomycetota bacterium]|nr:16S rRNA (cytosine(1402)-N(4))-methyltransferase RsmH [Planctomycetota bacterium]